jgi:Uncharacterised BCR, YnfA/UPF0060 family
MRHMRLGFVVVTPMNLNENIPINNPVNDQDDECDTEPFEWTIVTVVQAIVLFVAAGVAEIGGGWLVWKAVRDNTKLVGIDRFNCTYSVWIYTDFAAN